MSHECLIFQKGQMWGQGQLKGQGIMIIRGPGESWRKFPSCYFCHKKLSFDVEFDGEFNGAIFIFQCCILWSQNEFENFTYGHFRSFWTI